LETTISLKNNRDFQRVYKRGNYKAGKSIVVYAVSNRMKINRLGVSVGKKVGNSVQRSRVTRLIRENYRVAEDSYKCGYDIVIMARAIERTAQKPNKKLKAVSLPDYYQIRKDLLHLSDKLGLIK